MMTKYIKTGTTEFEQFNETKDQCFKFGIIDKAQLTSVESIAYGDDRYTIPTLEGDMVIHPTDWIATGVEGEHWPVKDEIFQKTYKKLPVIPKSWADTIEEYKANHYRLEKIFTDALILNYDEQELIARAWLDGYEIADD